MKIPNKIPILCGILIIILTLVLSAFSIIDTESSLYLMLLFVGLGIPLIYDIKNKNYESSIELVVELLIYLLVFIFCAFFIFI